MRRSTMGRMGMRVGLVLAVACNAVAATAAPGDIDTGFAREGIAVLDPPATSWRTSAPAVQRDGRIVVCRSGLQSGGNPDVPGYVYRLTRDGAPDHAFGSAGRVVLDANAPDIYVPCLVAARDDGRIVVMTQQTYSGRRAVRFIQLLADGSKDPAFGTDGVADVFPFDAPTATASAMALQDDGKILVGASLSPNKFGVARVDAHGIIDAGFGESGLAVMPFPVVLLSFSSVHDIRIDTGGRIVVTGTVSTDPVGRQLFAIARLLVDGRPDPTFGTEGLVTIDVEDHSAPVGAGFLDGDAIVVAGAATNPWSPFPGVISADVGVARLASDGRLDTTFGNGRPVIVPVDLVANGYDIAYGGVARAQGGVVLASSADDADGAQATLLALDVFGVRDAAFGMDGVMSYALVEGAVRSGFTAIAMQDSDYIAVGSAAASDGLQTAVVIRVHGAAAVANERGHSAHARAIDAH